MNKLVPEFQIVNYRWLSLKSNLMSRLPTELSIVCRAEKAKDVKHARILQFNNDMVTIDYALDVLLEESKQNK